MSIDNIYIEEIKCGVIEDLTVRYVEIDSAVKLSGGTVNVTSVEDAVLTKEHNDSNCLALGAKNVSFELAKDIVDAWLTTTFTGGRHLNRVNKIRVIEE